MRQLLVAFVAAAALVASQNSAQAVFEKVIIDNFDLPQSPPGSLQVSAPDPGTDQALSGVLASNRNLTAANGAMTAGGPIMPPNAGELQLNIQSGQQAVLTLALAPANQMFPVFDPLIFLTDVAGASGSMIVEAFFGGTSLGTHFVAAGNAQDLSWFVSPLVAQAGADELSFVFTAGEIGFFGGSVQDVVANPEPATMALMGLGVLGGAIGYRRRRKDDAVAPVEA